ncbi:MAG: M1 family metallopeptidase [Nocardioides sp.]|nr:M1 family metallopeptidase [Nocardioides sp.]
MSPLRGTAAALAGVLLLTVGAAAAEPVAQRSSPAPGLPGAGDGYFPADGNGGYDVVHYGIRNRMILGQQRIVGATTITARATGDLSRFNLDFLLRVKSVKVNGTPAKFTRPGRHELRVTPKQTIDKGRSFKVRVTYAGRPAGIGWAGEKSWIGNREEAVAMGEPHIAAYWFPSNDHPSDKAKFDIRIEVRKGLQAIANGRLVSRRAGKKMSTWHWRADEPMATYLAFFAAGRYKIERGRTRDGLPWINAVSREFGPTRQRRAMRFLRMTPRVLRQLESWLGDYPFSTTGGLVTSLDVAFALENQTRPTYPFVGGRGQTSLVAHELAHQWFGDKVAVKNWRDIWVNEGLASYMELLTDGWGFRSPAAWLRHAWGASSGSVDWRLRIGDPGPARLFAPEVYERGAMAAQALRNRIGTPDFKRLLRSWVTGRTHGSNADFKALAEEISAEDLGSFFNAWLYTGKRPARTAENGYK